MSRVSPILAALLALLTGAAHANAVEGESPTSEGRGVARPSPQESTCAGVRGNGRNLFAHFGVLARHTEEYGAVTCAAGGSSGAITVFVLESIWANPDVQICNASKNRPCRPATRDARISLMLKSFTGLAEAGLFEDAATLAAFLQAVQDQNIMGQMQGPTPRDGVDALIRLLRDLGPLINRDFIDLLINSPDPVFHAVDVIEGLQDGVQFVVNDPRVYLRTSVLDFGEVAELFGLYGSFYASYGPADRRGIRRWLRACARPSVGLTWAETSALPGTDGATCGENFNQLFNAYRERFAAFDGRSRVDDRIGAFLPVFGVTGAITGASVEIWRAARAAWLAATPIPFEPNFDDVGVGYWGRERDLRRMARTLERDFDDLGSRQFVQLDRATWKEILAASTAEPGFNPATPLSNGALSLGGWADPLRVIPLEALGAQTTIAVNRLGGVGSFTMDATALLNATDGDLAALYSLTDPSSTFSVGLDEASGVWCTDWDGQMSDPNLLFEDAYTSPLITDAPQLLLPRRGYPNVGPDFIIEGCNPAQQTTPNALASPFGSAALERTY